MNGDRPLDERGPESGPERGADGEPEPVLGADRDAVREPDSDRRADREPDSAHNADRDSAPDADVDRDPDPDSDEAIAKRWDAYELPEPSRGRVIATRIVVPLIVVALVGAGYFVWTQWQDSAGCRPDSGRVIDAASQLCYDNPEGWTRLMDVEIEQRYKGPGLAYATSGLQSEAEGSPTIEVSVDEFYYADGANADVSLVEFAKAKAVSSELMQDVASPETESEAITIDGHEAATATAFGAVPSPYQEGDRILQFWVKVTVVDVGEGVSTMYSSVLVPERELSAEDGEIATIEEIHESISVQS